MSSDPSVNVPAGLEKVASKEYDPTSPSTLETNHLSTAESVRLVSFTSPQKKTCLLYQPQKQI